MANSKTYKKVLKGTLFGQTFIGPIVCASALKSDSTKIKILGVLGLFWVAHDLERMINATIRDRDRASEDYFRRNEFFQRKEVD